MRRFIVSALHLPMLAIPFVIAAAVAEPASGPGLRAQKQAECRRKAVFSGGEMHCHEEGNNCVITCPSET